jgi:hypothetical protein
MKYYIRTILFVLLLSVYHHAGAQYFPHIKSEISKHVQGFDSVILFYSLPTNGMPREFKFGGYGLKDTKVFRIKMIFNAGGNFVDDELTFKNIEEIKETNKAIIDSVKTIPFSSVMILCEDSLNIKPDAINVYDGSNSVFFVMKNEQYVNILSYEPEYFQYNFKTKDRAQFLDIKNKLQKLLETPLDSDLINMTKDFDSVILIRSWSDYKDYLRVSGFAIKGDSCFRLDVIIDNGIVSGQEILKSFTKEIVTRPSIADSVRAIPFSSIIKFNNDFLEEERYEYYYSPFNDRKELYLYEIKGGSVYQKKAYDPHLYLPEANKDKEKFIDIVYQLDMLLGKPW